MKQTILQWSRLAVYCLMAVLAVGALATAHAQTLSTSQISGTVTDQSGAAIASAQVVLTNTATSIAHTVTSNATGGYLIADVTSGSYTMQVTAAGFATYVQKNIVIQVGTNPSIIVKMAVGSITQQVVVETTALQVETSNTGVGQVIDQARVVDMPLNGRDPDQLISLAGAATTAAGGDLNSNKNFPTVVFSVAGGLPNGMNYVLDGGIHNEATNGLNLPQPMPDALQEFKVETSALPAQYGDHAAAAINAITKSGGNQFHGDAFEFVRNYKFNALNSFSNYKVNPWKDGLKRNQFGGTLGGPILKNKLFFFGGLQHSIVRAIPTSSYTQVPTEAMLLGDFSQVTGAGSTNCNASAINLSGPFATVGGVPNQFTGALSTQVQNLMKHIPYALPSGATAPSSLSGYNSLPDVTALATGGKYSGNCGYVQVKIPGNSRQDNAIGRVDWTLNDKNSIFARYFLGINSQPIPSDPNALNVQAVQQYNRDQGITAGDTYIFSQNLVNALRLTANRVLNLRTVPAFFGPLDLGISSSDYPYAPISGFMGFLVNNGISLGNGAINPGHFNSTTWQLVDDVSYIHGNHEFGVGVDYMYSLMDTINVRPTNGIFSFTGQTDSSNGSYGYADLWAGVIDSFQQGLPDVENDGESRIALYAQDSWKLSHHLTLNYGIRWQPFLAQHNSNGHTENFNMANFTNGVVSKVYTGAPAGMIFDGDAGMPGNHYTNNKYAIFDPRIGLIWDPFGDGKTSVRASFGMFHDSPQMFFTTRYSNSPPFGSTVSLNNVPINQPWLNYPTAGANADPMPGLSSISKSEAFPLEGIYVNMPLDLKVMYLEQWNLAVQRQIGTWLLSASYLGNRTVHLETANEADPALYMPGTSTGVVGSCQTASGLVMPASVLPAAGAACSTTKNYNQRRFLFLENNSVGQYYSTIGTYDPGGVAGYNGLLVSVQRKTKNMNILANYTLSHCVSEAETTELSGPTYLDPNNRRASYSNCDSDHRQILNTTMVLTTPTFDNRLAKALVSDWQLSPIFTAQTGGFSTIFTGVDNSLSGISAGTFSPSEIATNPANPYGTRGNFGKSGYLVLPSNFTPPAAGTFGIARPYSVHGLSTYELDTALVRSFAIPHTQSQNAQIRWEVFNVTNEDILGGALSTVTEGFGGGTGGGFSNTLNSPSFGNFTSSGNPRIMQFALKYTF